jgi:hypothetical protein
MSSTAMGPRPINGKELRMTHKSFNSLLILFVLLGMTFPTFGKPDKQKSDKQKSEEKKYEEALEKRLAEEKEVKAQFEYTFNDVDKFLVIVSCSSERGRSSGSGFVATMNGKPYLFTNQHVIMGSDKITFKTASGKTLKPRGVELASNLDIARLLLAPETETLEISDTVSMDMPIAVFGNSEGGGVATELYGKVNSIGSDRIEVSADFVSGNSGSPVLNLDKEVIGIASYVSWKTNKKDETVTKRFCYRFKGEQWGAVNWKKYNDAYGKQYRETEALIESIIDIISSWYVKPSGRIDADSHPVPGLRTWSRDHNKMVNKIEDMLDQGQCTQDELDRINRKVRNDLMNSADDLSKVCKDRARALRMLNAKKKGMSGFLHNEFDKFSERLDNVARNIDKYGDSLDKYNYFHFK